MSFLDSVIGLTKDVFEVVSTPVEIAVDLTDAAIKPMAEAAKEIKDDIKSLKD